MTDLEDLWNSLPTGQPPTARIVQQAQSQRARRPAMRRPLLALGAVGALAGAFAAGTVVAGPPAGPDGPGGRQTDPSIPFSPVAFQADLEPAGSCADLLATYVDRGLAQVTAWGWRTKYDYYWELTRGTRGRVVYDVEAGGLDRVQTSKTPLVRRVTSSDTGTNVQEELVDEPDSVKTDGELLVRLRDDELITYDVAGPRVRELGALQLRGFEDAEILLAGDTVVVVGADRQSERSDQTGLRSGSRVQTVSIEDPSEPTVTEDVTYDAAATSVRQQGTTIRVVMSADLPDLGFVQPRRQLSQQAALQRNRELVRRSTLSDWLPGFDTGDGRQELLDCGDVAIPSSKVGLDTAAVVTFTAGAPDAPQAFGLAGATTIAYESTDHLYLASTPYEWGCFACRLPGVSGGTSYLFQFDLEADRAVHVASGEVEGSIRDRWSLDEAEGELRVLVGPSSETGNFNSVVTFERRGTRLVESGRLARLGVGEEIKSVRWQDDVALVVTYRQTDPLYVVDLRTKPKLLSELRVPGYSSYLHPLGPGRLVGVGYGRGDDGWGAQLGLFRVRDLAHVRQLDVWHYGRGSYPLAATDPRSFTWLPEHRTVFTVIRQGRTGWLSIQHLEDSLLHNRMVRVEYGDDAAVVRVLGLPDGRIALVTGEDVRFLRL
ncbi:MAG TPA: beta-propeller domain-containing protein [Nocardioidaceae bacterium]|nr:beta-propeller domain-containing protein [Nocardioidaceae bacterium]